MSDRPAPLPDPPVPGTIVWRGWLTKKGSFIPTLRRRFGTLQIGPDYEVTMDYRENATSSTSKGVFTFTSATKFLDNASSMGSIPVEQCLVVQIHPSIGAKIYCGFDTVDACKSFHAAVEWAVNAKAHVAAFLSKQAQAKQDLEELDVKRIRELLQTARPEPCHEPSALQQPANGQQAAAVRARKHFAMEDQEFISQLLVEVNEHQNTIHSLFGQSQCSSWAVDLAPSAATVNRPFSQDPVSRLMSVGGPISPEFVQEISQAQQAYAVQLALLNESAVS